MHMFRFLLLFFSCATVATAETPVKPATAASKATRLESIAALGHAKDTSHSKGRERAVDSLLKLLDTRDEAVHSAAMGSLNALRASTLLVERLNNPKLPERTRQNAAMGLRYLKETSSVGALKAALHDSSAKVRAEAALALSLFAAAEAETELVVLLDDADKDVRYYAADALGGVKTDNAKAALQRRLAVEGDETVKFALKGALNKF